MQSKRYYWIKLKTDFFNETAIDFLLSQKNGCEYVVLYQMLCLKCANTNGLMHNTIGEMIIPYDVDKIVRDTKYFDFDTVTVALELYKKLGLIYTAENGVLAISNYEEMVGSETAGAVAVRNWRKKKEDKKLLQCNNNVTQENRDKSIENRDNNIDINNIDNINNICNDQQADQPSSKPSKPKKKKYGTYKHVLLSDDELQKLRDEYGDELTKRCIIFLDEYTERKGYKCKSHYLTIKDWVLDAVKERERKKRTTQRILPTYTQQEQSDNDPEEKAKLLAKIREEFNK